MDIINFQYVTGEYDDSDVYLPSKNIIVVHNMEAHPTLPEVVDTFKDFLLSIGFLPQTINLIQVGKTPLELALASEEESV